ncbi:MAG: hypothetical protein EXR76_01710 [Myxococcales bacterium]|nr:hypothetical protein [Myxococcales bacterium]
MSVGRALLLGLTLSSCAGATIDGPDMAGTPFSEDDRGQVIQLPDRPTSGGADGSSSADGRLGEPDGQMGSDTAGGAGGAVAPSGPDTGPPDPTDDLDQDGVSAPADCDDADPRRYPGARELPGDGLDANCDAQDALPCNGSDDCPPAWYCARDFTCQSGCRADDCRDGLRCHSLDRVCLPDDANFACGRDADCPQGTLCRLYRIVGAGALGATCEPPQGVDGTGAACADGSECQSGLCLYSGTCGALCRDDRDCPMTTTCAWTRFYAGETENRVHVCMGPLTACVRSEDCRPGLICAAVPRPDQPRGHVLGCVPGPDGVGVLRSGAACARDEQCQSGQCLAEGRCLGPCGGDVDCAQGQRCYEAGIFIIDDGGTVSTVDDVLTGLPQCGPDHGSEQRCDELRRCPIDEVCLPRVGVDGRTYETRCFGAQGPGAAGVACENDAECASGDCIAEHCFGLCFELDGCGEGSRCINRQFVLDDRNTMDLYDDLIADLGLCVPE